MKKMYLLASLALTINVFAQTTCSVTITYTAPTCSSCCDGIVTAQVTETTTCSPFNYSWDGGAFSPSNSTMISLCGGTTYTVTIQDGGGTGCCGTMTGTVTIPSTTGIEKVTNNYELNIYPNPSNGSFSIRVNEYKNTTVEVYNTIGQKVLDQDLQTNLTQLNLANFSNGIYQLRVLKGDTLVYQTKVVKQE